MNSELQNKNLFVLDTNVLIHDPTALFRFQEHDIFLPMVVLEELDNNKKGHSEVARNARQASRFLNDLTCNATPETFADGFALQSTNEDVVFEISHIENASGKLFFQTVQNKVEINQSFPLQKNDNEIIGITHALHEKNLYKKVILVSKDINLRIKAASIGVLVEDYHNDQVLDDVNLLYKGYEIYDGEFWQQHDKEIESWVEEGHTYYQINTLETDNWSTNQFIRIEEGEQSFDAIIRQPSGYEGNQFSIVEQVNSYYNDKHSVWGITARNPEQNYALNLLLDPEIEFVTLLGQAGTGKTLLTLAAGLKQVMDNKLYSEIIMTRVTVSVGEDIGFLPGTEEEKMAPWMGALMDNMEVLTSQSEHSEWGRAATNDLLSNKIKIRALNFMRGRTFLNRFIIIDEAQNLTPKQMRTLITRAGPGTKVVCLGNLSQIDTPYLTETSSGLTYVVDRFRNWQHSGHITLQRVERSRLADYATDVL